MPFEKTGNEVAMEAGGRIMAVNLDIANVFNSLPWRTIHRTLLLYGVPEADDRRISVEAEHCFPYTRRRTNQEGRYVQGLVLGPLLWDIAYDTVLRTAKLLVVVLGCCGTDAAQGKVAGGNGFCIRHAD